MAPDAIMGKLNQHLIGGYANALQSESFYVIAGAVHHLVELETGQLPATLLSPLCEALRRLIVLSLHADINRDARDMERVACLVMDLIVSCEGDTTRKADCILPATNHRMLVQEALSALNKLR